ncbi:MAG TPA: SpoIIE family protein phosphatase, partial [Gemmataceae bacterium]|nr:SpoIIE family protein phosphatase [Gemmataceae bacterium]
EGFQVLQASTGAEALRLVQKQPDIAILDVNLPDMSGFEVCRRIKEDPATASLLVLHLSGLFSSSDDRIEGLEGGADGYLVKPVTPRELVAQVKALLRIRQAEQAVNACETKLQHILDHAPVLVHVKDREGRYLLVNRLWEQRFHRSRSQVIGCRVTDIFPPDYADILHANDLKVFQADAPLEFEETVPQDGEARTYLSIKFPLRDSDGTAYAVCGIAADISERKQAEWAAAEFRVARRIQQKLFPTSTPQVAGMDICSATFGFDISGASYPAEAIGGDYYDYLALGDGCLGIAIGDVSGHGTGPALLMAEARAYLRAFAHMNPDPGAILRLVNRVILPDIEGDRFITLLLAHLEPRRRSFTYASAGHPTGYIFNAAGEVKKSLPSTSIPLGIMPDCDFPSTAPIDLDPGDLVLFLTDGIVEARAPDGSVFGAQRTLDLVRVYRCSSAREIVENLYHAVRAFAQDQPQYDDITATVIKVGGAG